MTGQVWTSQDRTGQNMTSQERSGNDRTEYDGTGHDWSRKITTTTRASSKRMRSKKVWVKQNVLPKD